MDIVIDAHSLITLRTTMVRLLRTLLQNRNKWRAIKKVELVGLICPIDPAMSRKFARPDTKIALYTQSQCIVAFDDEGILTTLILEG